MEFEYDVCKSGSNKEKHGVDFIEGQGLWQDKRLLTIPLQYVEEERFIAIGRLASKMYSAVFTYRQEKIRLISIRRARKEEVKLYENH
jgi:uncharacterized protein